MSLMDTIKADLKTAMLAKDVMTRDTLRLIKSELDKGDVDDVAVLARAVKTRKDSIKSYVDAGREDLAEQERAELVVIDRYLPKQLGEDEIRTEVSKLVSELGVSGKQEMGKVMKELKVRFPGQIDGKLASGIVASVLS
jgi:uncharacterized protein YqeY